MSVIITNIDKHPRETGPHEYVVKINSATVACFTHNREDGLATCLRRAANAVQRVQRYEERKP